LPSNLHEISSDRVRDLDLDLIIYQTPKNLNEDGPAILSAAQRNLPSVYLEHNAPRPHPVDTPHPAADRDLLLVHVTQFNRLMWDNGPAETMVVEHSVAIDPAVRYDGSLAAGIVVVNNMPKRPRITGFDLFRQARERVPLQIVGMGAEELGGIANLAYRDLHWTMARYRFLFSPIRYTSLPLAVIEAMTIGMPVVALATTELPTVIEDGRSGFISCDPEVLIERMAQLRDDEDLARRLGAHAREVALSRFGLERFTRDWNAVFARALARREGDQPAPSGDLIVAGAA
jgi:hypothetical protein